MDNQQPTLTNIDPQKYFEYIKSKKQQCDIESLQVLYENTEQLLKDAFSIKQEYLVKRLLFTMECLEKEKKLYDLGIRTFVYREDIEYYIDHVAKNVVKTIDLKDYPRTIPKELIQCLQVLNKHNLFTDYYIIFTDYTDVVGRTVKKEEKRKDPILFGAFHKEDGFGRNGILYDRFYYIGDWEDEYCDLTLSKMISEMATHNKMDVKHDINDSSFTIEEIRNYVDSINPKNNRILNQEKPNIVKRCINYVKGLLK